MVTREGEGPRAGNARRLFEEWLERGAELGPEGFGDLRGGMGVVYRAFDEQMRRRLALKRMALRPEGTAGAAGAVLRFLDEAQVTGQLHHPGIVPVHDVGIDADGSFYYTMKFVRGDDLGTVLDKCRRADADWPKDMCSGRC